MYPCHIESHKSSLKCLFSSSRVSPTPHSLSATLKEEELSVRKITEVISLPVPGFISSEDEEEEVMISGNIRSKYFKNKVKLTK